MYTKPPGIEDIFPDRIVLWNHIIDSAREVFRKFNYREMIVPVIEYTDVFSRGIGQETDIVSKEMFTFEDRGGRNLALRPEGTAGVVRAYVENGEYNRLSTCKLFYCGPMFRAERPQKGRLRQFSQFGAEFFGSDHPWHDFEIIAMMNEITKSAGIENFRLIINSIGCPECRKNYLVALYEYYSSHREKLCGDCKRRLEKNPLRVLDCKNEPCVALKHAAPAITAFLDEKCRDHFSAVKEFLEVNGIVFAEDPFLVRGLDYYTRTTFEFISDSLGGQNAFAGGGRYDLLVEQSGGKPTPAVGFAAGMERMMLLLTEKNLTNPGVDVFIVNSGAETLKETFILATALRNSGFSVDFDPESKGFKTQFKKADRERALFAVIIGEDEISGGFYSVRNMKTGSQDKVTKNELTGFLHDKIK